MDALIFPPQVVGDNKYDRVEGRIVKYPITVAISVPTRRSWWKLFLFSLGVTV